MNFEPFFFHVQTRTRKSPLDCFAAGRDGFEIHNSSG